VVAFCKNPSLRQSGLTLADESGRRKNEMPNAVPKLLHARMLLEASGGFLTGYDGQAAPVRAQLLRRHVHKLLIPAV
jgi:hypothetical protein